MALLAGVAAFLIIGTAMFAGADDREIIEKTGTVLENGAKMGFVVPKYTADGLGISSITDINSHAGTFKGKIVGIDAGAGLTAASEKAIEEYGLNLDLVISSEAAMLAALSSALARGEHIVVTLWSPHWVWGACDLVYLDDPDLVFGETESIESWSRQGLAAGDTVLAGIMANYSFEMGQFDSLLTYLEDSDKEKWEAAGEWVEDNPELLEKWLDGIAYREGRGTVRIGLVSWACAMGSSYALKYILEEHVGYNVEIIDLDAGMLFAGMAYGLIDVTTTVWLPLTHTSYIERYG